MGFVLHFIRMNDLIVIIKNLKIMKSKLLIFFGMSVAVLIAGCKDTKIDTDPGVGSMTYEEVVYPLNYSTSVTYSTDTKHVHSVTFTDTGNGNVVFNFSVKDDNPQKGITAGSYETAIGGDYTARFSIEGIGDFLAGTMSVTISGGNYTFHFNGTTIDENTETKTVVFTYTGKIIHS